MHLLSDRAIVLCLVLSISPNVHAGLYADDLSGCLVESATVKDKSNLTRWIFSAAALHPAVSSIVSITEEERDAADKVTAELFVKLLIESCKEQAQKAVKYEGQVAIRTAFQVLGQVAAAELFASPKVKAGMDNLDKHFDKKIFQETFGKK